VAEPEEIPGICTLVQSDSHRAPDALSRVYDQLENRVVTRKVTDDIMRAISLLARDKEYGKERIHTPSPRFEKVEKKR